MDNQTFVDDILKMEYRNRKNYSLSNSIDINYWQGIIFKKGLCELYLQRKPIVEKEMESKRKWKRKIYRNK